MKDVFEIMPRAAAELFLRLQHEPLLHSFVLIGGTALSLHLGHRRSEDLDYISCAPKLPRAELDTLFRNLQHEGRSVLDDDDPDAVFDFLNAGMQLHDYSHTVLVDGASSVTFFVAEDSQVRILGAGGVSAGPRIASLHELSQLKALVARSRSNSRDWLDLYILERDHGFSLAEWRKTYEQAGLRKDDFENALRRICSGILSVRDPGLEGLLIDPPTVPEISAHFSRLRAEYETTNGHHALRGQDPGV